MTEEIGGRSTHFPVLEKSLEITNGAVLELGTGFGSTQELHRLCKGRRLVSLDNDPRWMSQFIRFRSENHEFFANSNFDHFDSLIRNTDWDVVLVDHAPASRRVVELKKLYHAKYIIVHDSEDPGGVYSFKSVFPTYKYQYLYDKLLPITTTVLSNICPLDEFKSVP